MKHVCILLANSVAVNFYLISEKDFHFKLIRKMQHPESRLKEQELDADRPGRYQKGTNSIKGTYTEPMSHKKLEIEHFAKEVCQECERDRIANQYEGIIIISNPYFYGLINKNASSKVKEMIKYHLPKDYTHYSEKHLTEELKALLAPEFRSIFIS